MYKLRELEREDIKRINKWRNDPHLISCLGAPYRFINEDVDSDWYDNYMNARSNSVRCAIVDAEKEDEVLGLISLLDINYINRCGDIHIMIGDPMSRGKGLGTFAVTEMISHAFNNINLRRIQIEVLETNTAAIKLYKKTGFVEEGVRRKATYKNGHYVSMIIMGLLREEWEENKNSEQK